MEPRTSSVTYGARQLTKQNGELVSQQSTIWALLQRAALRTLRQIPGVAELMTDKAMRSTFRYSVCEASLLVSAAVGGGRIDQVWMRRSDDMPIAGLQFVKACSSGHG